MVISIIGLLVLLLLPAVQIARESSRQAQCRNNLKQIGLAIHNYSSAFRVFPPGGMLPTVVGKTGWNRTSLTNDFSTAFTWPSLILPGLEQMAVYDLYDFKLPTYSRTNSWARSQPVSTYVCPADTLQIDEPWPGQKGWYAGAKWNYEVWARMRVNYAANYGNTGYMQQDLGGVKFLGGFFTNGAAYDDAMIIDGLSNTIAFSEVLPVHGPEYGGPPGDMQAEGGQAFEGYLTPNSSSPDVVCNRCTTKRAITVPCVVNMTDTTQTIASRSLHPGGVDSVMGDGAARFFANTIDAAVWRALCSSRGGEAITLP